MKENRDEHIRESINKIEPAEGAKERMLANIKRKAAEQVIAENAESKPEKQNIAIQTRYEVGDAGCCLFCACRDRSNCYAEYHTFTGIVESGRSHRNTQFVHEHKQRR